MTDKAMNIDERVLRIWGIQKCGNGIPCANCDKARKEFEQFFLEIKKRCMEECEKKRVKIDSKTVDHLGVEIYNEAINDCKQAIDRMEIE